MSSVPVQSGEGSVFEAVDAVRKRLSQRVIGQTLLVDRLLIALLTDGHLLVEGAPGLAKTRAIRELAELIEGSFQRIQFTPDLLPADITGTEIYRPAEGSFVFQQGPLFNNLVLADEINRAPAKVQSALLEAMAEQQISIGQVSYQLPPLFMVMATQNPIEQEGTYPLPEAQLDRFLMHVSIDYPESEHEIDILNLVRAELQQQNRNHQNLNSEGDMAATQAHATYLPTLTSQHILAARSEVLSLYMSPDIEDYLVRLVTATRQPEALSAEMGRWLKFGASPRGTIALDLCARANAWLAGRDYVSPDDVQSVIFDVLRHRLILSYEAEADDVNADAIIETILNHIAVP